MRCRNRVAVPLDGRDDARDFGEVDTEADDVWHDQTEPMKPQPSGGFEWVQARRRPGARLPRARSRIAAHLFTTRDWALGSRAEATGRRTGSRWRPSLGVDAGASGPAAPGPRRGGRRPARRRCAASAGDPLPDADIADLGRSVAGARDSDRGLRAAADRRPRTGAVAAAHAGWRGLAAGVPGVTVAALAREFGSAPADLIAAIGPSIARSATRWARTCARDSSPAGSQPAQLARWFPSGRDGPATGCSTAGSAARDQLESAGLAAGPDSCRRGSAPRRHPDLFCSYRRDGSGRRTDRRGDSAGRSA